MPLSMKQRVANLTKRQREVVRLTSLGCTVEEIAAILDIAVATADNHRLSAMRTLGVGKATLLTRIAIKCRVSPLDEKLTPREKRRRGRKKDGWN
jgi:DNA-binding CsgD family transcriptional regulator